jgi:4-oxalocrotonate tautomerase
MPAEGVFTMPYVNVRITRGATVEQKARIVAEMTQTLVEVLGKKPEHTHVIIDEIDEENWGFAGLLTTVFRERERESHA